MAIAGFGNGDNTTDGGEMKAVGGHDALATAGCIRAESNMNGKPVVLIVIVIVIVIVVQIQIASSWSMAMVMNLCL